ncbi:MAG: pyridoxal-5-phosphate-dependent protein subunit beta, partial [Chloroflexi bacterium]|nr:pyridoxal-5-phosphate-dependent protein subunit beta [Chloroflexota bacterium]
MTKIDLTVLEDRLQRAVKRARERDIIIPTFAQQKDPSLVPDSIKKELKGIGLWDITPRNLYLITWKNEPVP